MSLRLRLLAGLAALVLFGLVTFGAGTYLALRHFLLSRLDQQLVDAATTVARGQSFGDAHGDPGPRPGFGNDPGAIRADVGPALFVELLDARGSVLTAVDSSARAAGPPDLGGRTGELNSIRQSSAIQDGFPVEPDGHLHPAGSAGPVLVFSAPSRIGGDERVALVGRPGTTEVIVVAGSMHPVTQTLDRLLWVELATGAAVLTISVLLGLALARQATRPLEAIAATADAIAAGELERRVQTADQRSEVGRVGVALNSMLNEIQHAFERRDATESRLRRFVADASHELSTPLTSIRGYAELFHRGLAERPEDLAKAMARIESEGARMGGLVDDLLLLASFDNGRPVQFDPVDLSRIASDAAADLRASCPDRAVTVEAATPVIVLGDDARIRQIAANLASNARRHTPAGTAVTIRARRDGEVGVLEVADRGPGLTPDAASRVFDRFYRVDKARARADGGAGLGLSIVATIAEALGGRVRVDTSPGKGATFSVAVPLARTGIPVT